VSFAPYGFLKAKKYLFDILQTKTKNTTLYKYKAQALLE